MLFTVLFILLAAHCIGDYPMQGEFLATYKSKDNVVLLVHCVIYTIFITAGFLLSMFLLDKDITTIGVNNIILITLLTHFSIDKWKCEYRKRLLERTDITENEKNKLDVEGYYIDQALHMVVLAVIFVIEI